MLKSISIIALICTVFLTVPASAQAKSFRKIATSSNNSSSAEPEFGIGGPFAIVSGHFGFGFLSQLMFPISKVQGLWIGPQVGFYHWSTGSSTTVNGVPAADTDSSANSIPIAGTAIWHLPKSAQFLSGGDVYIGTSMGFSLSYYSASVRNSATNVSVSTNSTDFLFLVRPGVTFGGDTGHLFYVEPTFGTIASSFIFAPTFGVNIPL